MPGGTKRNASAKAAKKSYHTRAASNELKAEAAKAEAAKTSPMDDRQAEYDNDMLADSVSSYLISVREFMDQAGKASPIEFKYPNGSHPDTFIVSFPSKRGENEYRIPVKDFIDMKVVERIGNDWEVAQPVRISPLLEYIRKYSAASSSAASSSDVVAAEADSSAVVPVLRDQGMTERDIQTIRNNIDEVNGHLLGLTKAVQKQIKDDQALTGYLENNMAVKMDLLKPTFETPIRWMATLVSMAEDGTIEEGDKMLIENTIANLKDKPELVTPQSMNELATRILRNKASKAFTKSSHRGKVANDRAALIKRFNKKEFSE